MNSNEKYNKLKSIIKRYDAISIAFSGGVDSCLIYITD
jgi:PP-loop superfamily ATP-utilizing enzyme